MTERACQEKQEQALFKDLRREKIVLEIKLEKYTVKPKRKKQSKISLKSNGSHPNKKSGLGSTDPTPEETMSGNKRVKDPK